jgi:hypothetical protein
MVEVHSLTPSLKRRFQKLLGPRVEVTWISNSGLDAVAGNVAWIEDVVFEMAARARNAMPFGGKLVVEWASIRNDDSSAGLRAGSYVMFEMTCVRRDLSELDEFSGRLPLSEFPDSIQHSDFAHVEELISSAGGQICEYNEPGRALTIRAFFPSASAAPNLSQGLAANAGISGE